MPVVKVSVTADTVEKLGRIDPDRVDATSEQDIIDQQAGDDQDAMQDTGAYVRRVRNRLGLSQEEFSQRIHVSTETLRNWEQGKRRPTGAARALLQIIDKSPELALEALH